jgi:hypothetical protein
MAHSKAQWIAYRNRRIKDRWDHLYHTLQFGNHSSKANIVLDQLELEFFISRQGIMKIMKSGEMAADTCPIYRRYLSTLRK